MAEATTKNVNSNLRIVACVMFLSSWELRQHAAPTCFETRQADQSAAQSADVGTMIWTSRAALGAGGRNGTNRVIIDEMKSRIEQNHEQHPDFALILPRRAAYAPLPQATKAGAKTRSYPVG
jgi:hypothetical protein